MIKNLKTLVIALVVVAALFAIYRLTCIRIVNYEIGGTKIPSEYNMITGKIKPILDYKGNKTLPVFQRFNATKLGLTDEQVAIAQLRWAVFEQWIKSHPEYKNWEKNANVFKKAHEAFRKELDASGPKVRVVK